MCFFSPTVRLKINKPVIDNFHYGCNAMCGHFSGQIFRLQAQNMMECNDHGISQQMQALAYRNSQATLPQIKENI